MERHKLSQGSDMVMKTPAPLGRNGADRSAFVARLHTILRHWPSADRLARAMGVSPSAFRKWLKGEAEPSRERLVALAEAAQVGIAWLARGEGPEPRFQATEPSGRRPRSSDTSVPHVNPSHFLLLPRRPDTAAAGAGLPPPPPYTSEYIAFQHEWLRFVFRVDPENLILEIAVGESMQPTIHDGDLLLIDTTDHVVRNFGIYVLEVAGERLVKRVQRKVDGSLVLISDNMAYQADSVPVERVPDVAVVGRVVWGGGVI
jgi:phage repressor protein C with HTH and peptisase S24 domain